MLILLTPRVVKMLEINMDSMYGSVNRYFYMVQDVFYGITFAVIVLPILGVIFKLRRSRKSKPANSS